MHVRIHYIYIYIYIHTHIYAYIYIYIYIEFSTVVLKFQTDLAKAPYANDEPLTCLERAWRAPPPGPVVLKTTEGRVL